MFPSFLPSVSLFPSCLIHQNGIVPFSGARLTFISCPHRLRRWSQICGLAQPLTSFLSSSDSSLPPPLLRLLFGLFFLFAAGRSRGRKTGKKSIQHLNVLSVPPSKGKTHVFVQACTDNRKLAAFANDLRWDKRLNRSYFPPILFLMNVGKWLIVGLSEGERCLLLQIWGQSARYCPPSVIHCCLFFFPFSV